MYVYQLAAAPGLRDALLEIPGVSADKGSPLTVRAPVHAAYLVEQLARAFGAAPALLSAPPNPPMVGGPWTDEDNAAVSRAIVDNPGVCSWLATGRGGPFQLLPFQLEAIGRCLRAGSAFLIEAPGAGKTVQATVWAALGPPGPVLFVTRSPLTRQVAREIHRFTGTETFELRPASKQRIEGGERLLPAEALRRYVAEQDAAGARPWVVAGWGSLSGLVDVLEQGGWASVVFDESHLAKSPDRWDWLSPTRGKLERRPKDTQSCAAYRIAERAGRRLAMTATPIPDRRRDLWGQLSIVDPEGWGITWTRFVQRYCGAAPGAHGGLDTTGETHTEELMARLSFVWHRVPREISHGQLPTARLTHVIVPGKQQDRAEGFKREMNRLAREAGKSDSDDARQALRELQLMEAAARKRTATIELVKEVVGEREGDSKGKAVLFTGRHADCFDLAERVRKALPDVEVLCGVEQDGKGFRLPNKQRREEIRVAYAEHPGPCVLVATGQSWGTGTDGMQDSDLLALVMLPYDPGAFVQWMGRVVRLGMTRPVTIAILSAEGTVDERVAAILVEKVADIERVGGQSELAGTRDVLLGIEDREKLLAAIVSKVDNAADRVSNDPQAWE